MDDTPLQWEMTDEETVAYQLAVLWTQKVREYFPDQRQDGNRLRVSGDPRKSSLFRHCIRMIRTRRGLVEPRDMKHYMVAQLHICKLNNEDNNVLITPALLSGEASWRRWKLYESALTKVRERRAGNSNPTEDLVNLDLVRSDLEISSTFLRKYVPEITPQFLKDRFAKGDLEKWVKFGFVRPYFVALSPTVQSLGIAAKELNGVSKKEVVEMYKTYFPKDKVSTP